MALPKHTCISCVNLWEEPEIIIPTSKRERALDNKNWNNAHINFLNCVCYKGKLPNPRELGKDVQTVRDKFIKPNSCKQWERFEGGFSPITAEQAKYSKWAKWGFWIALATLVVVLATWLLSQFLLN